MDQTQMARLLEELGTTPEEVATSLKASGVRGVRNDARFLNIIVRYVQSRIRVDVQTLDMMAGDKLRMILGSASGTLRKVETGIPEPVRQFLDAFDRGHYPDLELLANGG
jgi:hypothetical protein